MKYSIEERVPKLLQRSVIRLSLLCLVFSISCSSDAEIVDIDEEVIEDSSNEDPDSVDPNGGDNTSNTEIDESVAFEQGLVLDKEGQILNYVISQSEYNKFIEGDGDTSTITKKIYEYLKDDFDFVFIMNVEEEHPGDLYYGRHSSAQNHVAGIGDELYNRTDQFGSAGRLKGTIHMPRTEYIKSGPFLHELVHYWGNYNFIESEVTFHWGFSSIGGQLGGFDELTDLGNNTYKGNVGDKGNFGTFANGGNSIPYGNAELYLMGLIPASELNPIMIAKNPVRTNNAGEFTADEIITLTAEDLIAEHGERVPSYENSQRAFNGIAVVLSTEPIGPEIIDPLNENLENFSRASDPDESWYTTNNFWRATQGKATLNIKVFQENIK